VGESPPPQEVPALLRKRSPARLGSREKLKADWSPEQISGWLKREYPEDEQMYISHETIYRTPCSCRPEAPSEGNCSLICDPSG
jgi:IS30 family transposase